MNRPELDLLADTGKPVRFDGVPGVWRLITVNDCTMPAHLHKAGAGCVGVVGVVDVNDSHQSRFGVHVPPDRIHAARPAADLAREIEALRMMISHWDAEAASSGLTLTDRAISRWSAADGRERLAVLEQEAAS